MTGLISGIKRMEIHDGDGLRTTVFFKGCPLKCIWCHNPESISFNKQIAFFKNKCIGCNFCQGKLDEKSAEVCPTNAKVLFGQEYTLDELLNEVLKDRDFFKNGNGGGVTLSGGECLAQPDFCIELAKLLYERGISVYVDTCGCVKRETFEKIIPYVDKFLYDIKAIDATVHEKCTGRHNRLILDNLKFLCEKGCKIEIRYPLVVGYNDTECENAAKYLSGLQGITKVKVLQYHSFAASRYEALGMLNTLPDTQTTLYNMEAAVNIFKSYGVHAVNGMRED
jgi:pyruvate formate lyase activating enzyme